MAAADLTVRNGVGVDAEAVLRPLDWRSSLRTRAATRRPLAGVASLTESLVVRCGDDAGLLLRVIQLQCGTKPAACTVQPRHAGHPHRPFRFNAVGLEYSSVVAHTRSTRAVF